MNQSKYMLENHTTVRINKTSDLRGNLNLNYSYISNTESLFQEDTSQRFNFARRLFLSIDLIEYDKTNISERYFYFLII